MKALVWHDRQSVKIEDVPEPPDPGPGQVKIEVVWCGICGTDLHEYLGGPLYIPVDAPHPTTGVQAPVILGHEVSGNVISVGQDVSRVKVGDRVALCPIIGCLECRWCRSGQMHICPNIAFLGSSWSGGGFAQYLNVHDYMCYTLPDEVSYEVGALVEPFSATVRAVEQGQIAPGKRVAVVGAGPMGLMTLQAARIAGADETIVLEIAARRQQLARDCGATHVVDPSREDALAAVRNLTGGDGADIVFECVGAPETGMLAGRLAAPSGRIVVVGVFEEPTLLDYKDLVYGGKTLIGTMGGYGFYEQAIRVMASGQFDGDALISGKISLDNVISDGFDALINHKAEHVKILVSPA